MITFRPIASSSASNCYLLSDNRTPIVLEAGVRLDTLRKATNYSLSSYAGLLVTHGHQDHGRHAANYMDAGLDCYCSQGTAETLGLSGHHLQIIEAGKLFKIGSWTVLPFDVVHDAEEPLGYLMANGNEKILFATDLAYTKYKFSGLTRIFIECNYQIEILDENIKNGIVEPTMKHRLIRSHFALHNVCEMLKANDMYRLKEIWLLHMSRNNADGQQMQRTIAALTGVPVYVAGG